MSKRDQIIDERDTQWQRGLSDLHLGHDGDGCESGDPIDWTRSAIRQHQNKIGDMVDARLETLIDERDAALAQLADARRSGLTLTAEERAALEWLGRYVAKMLDPASDAAVPAHMPVWAIRNTIDRLLAEARTVTEPDTRPPHQWSVGPCTRHRERMVGVRSPAPSDDGFAYETPDHAEQLGRALIGAANAARKGEP